jgi:hypothetical protein
MMRFRGGGVGHKSTREATNFFKKDRDKLDLQKSAGVVDGDIVVEAEERDRNENPDEFDEEGDYGYIREDSDTEGDEPEDEDEWEDEEFGPEDEGGIFELNLGDLGYGEL